MAHPYSSEQSLPLEAIKEMYLRHCEHMPDVYAGLSIDDIATRRFDKIFLRCVWKFDLAKEIPENYVPIFEAFILSDRNETIDSHVIRSLVMGRPYVYAQCKWLLLTPDISVDIPLAGGLLRFHLVEYKLSLLSSFGFSVDRRIDILSRVHKSVSMQNAAEAMLYSNNLSIILNYFMIQAPTHTFQNLYNILPQEGLPISVVQRACALFANKITLRDILVRYLDSKNSIL